MGLRHPVALSCFVFLHARTATHCNTNFLPLSAGLRQHVPSLQHTATHCNTLQHTATHCNTLQHTVTHCNTLQLTATRTLSRCQEGLFNMHTIMSVALSRSTYPFPPTATHCSTLQHTTPHCNTLQYTATHCNTHTLMLVGGIVQHVQCDVYMLTCTL